MSWDIQIGDEDFNLTYNYSYIFNDAGVGVREMDGMLMPLVKHQLMKVRAHIENQFDELKAMEWDKCRGWGTVEQCYDLVCHMILACAKNQDSVMEVK